MRASLLVVSSPGERGPGASLAYHRPTALRVIAGCTVIGALASLVAGLLTYRRRDSLTADLVRRIDAGQLSIALERVDEVVSGEIRIAVFASVTVALLWLVVGAYLWRRSQKVRWIAIVLGLLHGLLGIGTVAAGLTQGSRTSTTVLSGTVQLIASLSGLVVVVLLLRPDVRAWYAADEPERADEADPLAD